MIIIQTCHELYSAVMRAIALGLELDETFFDDKIDEQYHNLRLLSYPPIKSSQLEEDSQTASGHIPVSPRF
jgi:isopenicillin N synthase-like dioxygenase